MIIIIINTQGQIVQIHLIRKTFLTEMQHETKVWKVVAPIRSAKQEPKLRKKKKEQKNSSTKIRANSGIELVSSGSHWSSEVV